MKRCVVGSVRSDESGIVVRTGTPTELAMMETKIQTPAAGTVRNFFDLTERFPKCDLDDTFLCACALIGND